MIPLAEIVEKMPTLGELWSIWLVTGLGIAAVTLVFSLQRLWLGALAAIFSLAPGIFTVIPDSFTNAIAEELGLGYLAQYQVLSFTPFLFSVVSWGIVFVFRRTSKVAVRNIRDSFSPS
jgi:hypothetical protein